MKKDNLSDIKVKYKLSQEELKNNPEKAKKNFIKNLNESIELRKQLWDKLYWDMKSKVKYRNNKDLMIKIAEYEWAGMSEHEKINQWYDFVTDEGKALGVIGELNYIAQLIKNNKGNMKMVWKELKAYGKMKKEDKQ